MTVFFSGGWIQWTKVTSETRENYEIKAETKLYQMWDGNYLEQKDLFPKDHYHSHGLNPGPLRVNSFQSLCYK